MGNKTSDKTRILRSGTGMGNGISIEITLGYVAAKHRYCHCLLGTGIVQNNESLIKII